MTDEEVTSYITNRATKVKTPESFKPIAKYSTLSKSLNAFMHKRKEHVDDIIETTDDLRNHYEKLSFGTLDGAQILIFMAGHTKRHVTQIEEIKENDNFPRIQ